MSKLSNLPAFFRLQKLFRGGAFAAPQPSRGATRAERRRKLRAGVKAAGFVERLARRLYRDA